jgi:nicotinate-nucleotide pyrophosphorylase (carboxylating)
VPSPPPRHIVARAVREALLEDLGSGDLTTAALVPADRRARGVVRAGEPLVAAGLDAARHAFRVLDPAASVWCVAAGSRAERSEAILRVEGRADAILSAERVALNFLGKLSGIATLTRRCVDAVQGTGAAILDTRKTTPGHRLLERHAVALGGGTNHRWGLADAVLIKDNHLLLTSGIGAAVRTARARYGAAFVIEVEVETLPGLDEALQAGADVILLDNMPVASVREAVLRKAARGGSAGRSVLLEASGGITLENLRAYAETGVDRISLGALTHSARWADVGLALEPL